MTTFIFFIVIIGFGFYHARRKNLKLPREYLIFGAGILGFLLLGELSNQSRYSAGESNLREQFHLPEGAKFVEIEKPRWGKPGRGVVEFSDADWRDFVANLNHPARATPFLFDFDGNAARHAQIARWQDMPPVMTAAEAPKHILDIPRVYEFAWESKVVNGKMLCVVYVAKNANGAKSCYDSTKDDRLYNFVVGVLDFDRKKLHVRVKS